MPQKEGKCIVKEEINDNGRSNGPLSASSVVLEAPTRSKRQLPHRRIATSSAHSNSKGSDSTLSRPVGFGLRRAILIGQRGGPSTPVPSWKLSDNSTLDPSSEPHLRHSRLRHHLQHSHQEQISARKLAASLWEVRESPFSKAGPTCTQENVQQKFLSMHQEASLTERQCVQDGQHVSPALSHISKRSHRKSSIPTKSGDKGSIRDELEKRREHEMLPNYSKEITANGRRTFTSKPLELSSKGILSNLSCGPTTTSNLLKMLNHVWHLEEQHASSVSLVGTMRVELDEARSQLQELLLKGKSFRKEVDNINTKLAVERALWQEQQEQNIMIAVQPVMQDLENERKSKQKLEVIHKKVAKEFRLTKKSLFRALEDLERERKARQLMEEVCDELAVEIGQDKARVEELKLESVKAREEVEEERKMLQMAEIWREERVQMKLMEAKLELEEKNSAFNKLRSQLEAFLKTKRADDLANDFTSETKLDSGSHSLDIVIGSNLSDSFHSKEQQSGKFSVDSGFGQQVKQKNTWSSYSDDDDDDLHSIELNHEPLVRTSSSNFRQQSFQHCEKELMKRGLSDGSVSTSDNCDYLARRFQGVETLETPKKDQQTNSSGMEGAGAESSAQGSIPQSCRWIESTVKGHEIRDWNEQEGQWSRSSKSCSSCAEDSQSLIPVSPQVIMRSNKMHPESAFKTTKSNQHLWHEQHRKLGDLQHQSCLSNRVSNPTKKCSHYLDLRSKVTTETGGDSK